MHRALIALSLSLALSGCHREPVGRANAEKEIVASASAAPAHFEPEKLDRVAKTFVDAALAYAETCDLRAEEPGDWFDFITYDECSSEPKVTQPVLDAGALFERDLPPMHDAPMAARALVDHVRVFRDWVGTVAKIRVTRGTMRTYQELALAYDAYEPDAKVPTEPKHALDQYFVAYPSRGVAYIWEQAYCYDEKTLLESGCDPAHPTARLDRYAIHRKRGTPLVWRTSPQGPFLAN